MISRETLNAALASTVLAALIVSGIAPYDRLTWLMEVLPAMIALPLLAVTRNPYDKLGHLMQGFVPAMVAREILLRGAYVRGRRMAGFLCICVAMAISACYELIEWGAADSLGQCADEFLGTQGDVWDTQSDMLMALIGSTAAIALLSRWHDRQLAKLKPL